MPQDGIHSVTVPGAVEGWYRMHQRFGKLPWKDLFHDAIAYAEQGFPVYEGMREVWADPAIVHRLEANAESKRVFLPGGKAPQTGRTVQESRYGARFPLDRRAGSGCVL